MEIVLVFDEMDSVAEQFLVEWLQEKVDDKSPENVSPLRYVKEMRVQRGSL